MCQAKVPATAIDDEVNAVDDGAAKAKDADLGRSWTDSVSEDDLVDSADEFEDALRGELLRTGVIEVWPGA